MTLEPLGPEHEDGLHAAAADEQVWRWMITRDVDAWIGDALSDNPDRQPFAVVHGGEVIGSTSYMSLAPEHRRLEIGNTWLASSAWGTGANTEAKYLLLRHAFDDVGALRVEFKTGDNPFKGKKNVLTGRQVKKRKRMIERSRR